MTPPRQRSTLRTLARRRILVPSQLHPLLLARTEALLAELGGRFAYWEGYRSPEDQQKRFDEGVSNARPGQSPHNYRPSLATDLVLHPLHVAVRAHPSDPRYPDLWDDGSPDALAAWEALEQACERHQLARVNIRDPKTGALRRDRPHVQMPNWHSLIPA